MSLFEVSKLWRMTHLKLTLLWMHHLDLMRFKACVLWSWFSSPSKAAAFRDSPLWSQCVSHLEVDACYRMDSRGVLNAWQSDGCFLSAGHWLLLTWTALCFKLSWSVSSSVHLLCIYARHMHTFIRIYMRIWLTSLLFSNPNAMAILFAGHQSNKLSFLLLYVKIEDRVPNKKSNFLLSGDGALLILAHDHKV